MSDPDRPELVERWARIEASLRTVLESAEVADETCRLVVEYLDHNKLGLAFQTLVGALADAASHVSQAELERLEQAAREMALEDDPAWRRLAGRDA